MSLAPRLVPNLGAEEGEGWAAWIDEPRIRCVAELWRLLFGAGASLLGAGAERADPLPSRIVPPWPESLGPAPNAAVFPWLEGAPSPIPWLETGSSRRAATVQRVHDKAFAHGVAEAAGWTPRTLRERIHVLEPELLAHPDQAIAVMASHLARWPTWAREAFTLKPRLGSSGRGRVAGSGGVVDSQAIRGALPRLARRGGALLEPWLDRTEDLSTQLHIDSSGDIMVLGTLRPRMSASGTLQGIRGGLDSRGRVFSESRFEEPAREAAAALAGAARDAGYRGVCGVDAFAFRPPASKEAPDAPPREELRAMLELNARFTVGTIAIGLLRRALPTVRGAIGLEPGVRRAFALALDAPPQGPQGAQRPRDPERGADPGSGAGADRSDAWQTALERAGSGAVLVRLHLDGAAMRPALLFARDFAALDAALDPG